MGFDVDFSQKITDLSQRSKHASKHALTEEATKTAVVLPFIQSLGFDVFNLEEVIPEFVADVGIKKGEKIDFAIKVDGKIAILVEVKPISMKLGDGQYSQLFRYFSTVEARLDILINGREVWFFQTLMKKIAWTKSHFLSSTCSHLMKNKSPNLADFKNQILTWKIFWKPRPT